jgi:hypothetical protein
VAFIRVQREGIDPLEFEGEAIGAAGARLEGRVLSLTLYQRGPGAFICERVSWPQGEPTAVT